MAHFYGSMQGSRGEATRMGTKNSGITAHIRGWDIGANVDVRTDSNGNDVVTVFLTHGSNNPRHAQCLGMFKLADDGTFEQVK